MLASDIPGLPLNRQAYRSLAVRMRGAKCSSCDSAGDFLTRYSKGHGGLKKYGGVTAIVGRTLGIPALVDGARAKTLSPLMLRSQTLAGTMAYVLAETPPTMWRQKIANTTTPEFAADVMELAATLARPIGSEAITCALALCLLEGAIAQSIGVVNGSTVAYQRALAAFDRATKGHKDNAQVRAIRSRAGLAGLGALGAVDRSKVQTGGCGPFYDVDDKIAGVKKDFKAVFGRAPNDAEVTYYGAMKWCTDGDDDKNTMRGVMRRIKAQGGTTTPGPDKFPGTWATDFGGRSWWGDTVKDATNLFDDLVKDVGRAGDFLIKIITAIGDKASDLLCRAFKAILPEPFGGVMCQIISVLLGAATGAAVAAIAIVKESLVMFGKMISALLKGDLKGAGWALLEGVNKIIVMMLGGPLSGMIGAPITKAQREEQLKTAKNPDDVLKSLEEIGTELAHDDPMWLIAVIVAAVGLIYSGGNPTGISALAVALSPVAAAVFAPMLKAKIPALAKEALADIKKGINVVIKIMAMVIVRVMSLKDVIQKFASAIKNYVSRLSEDGKVTSELVRLRDTFGGAVSAAFQKISSGKLKDMGQGLKDFAAVIPVALIAFAKDDPDLSQALDTGKQIFAAGADLVVQAQRTWDEAFKTASPAEKQALAKSQYEKAKQQYCSLNPQDAVCRSVPGATPQGAFDSLSDTEKSNTLAVYLERLDFAKVKESDRQTVTMNVIRAIESLGTNLSSDARLGMLLMLISKSPASEHAAIARALATA